jgi:hypothetical protein
MEGGKMCSLPSVSASLTAQNGGPFTILLFKVVTLLELKNLYTLESHLKLVNVRELLLTNEMDNVKLSRNVHTRRIQYVLSWFTKTGVA